MTNNPKDPDYKQVQLPTKNTQNGKQQSLISLKRVLLPNKIFCTEYGKHKQRDFEPKIDEFSLKETNGTGNQPFQFQKVKPRPKDQLRTTKIDMEFKKYEDLRLLTITQFKRTRDEIRKTKEEEAQNKRVNNCRYKKSYLSFVNDQSNEMSSNIITKNNFITDQVDESNIQGSGSKNADNSYIQRSHVTHGRSRSYTANASRLNKTEASIYSHAENSHLNCSHVADLEDSESICKRFGRRPVHREKGNQDQEKMQMKIKRAANNHKTWVDKNETTRTQLKKEQEKIQNNNLHDYDRNNILESMSTWQDKLNVHVGDRYLGIKRRAERSQEKHERLYGQSWRGVSADRKIGKPTNYDDPEIIPRKGSAHLIGEGFKKGIRWNGTNRFLAHFRPKSHMVKY